MQSTTIIASLAILALSVGSAMSELRHTKLKITTFYEAEDPASIDFIMRQYYPTYELIGKDWLDVKFVPYGLARSDFTVEPCRVYCHNSANNCDLDKYSVCGIDILRNDPDKLSTFVNCVAEHTDSTFVRNGVCAKKVKFAASNDPYDCANKSVGEEDLCYMGKLTPKDIKSTPLVYINGKKPTDKETREILTDFLSYVCGKLGRQPPNCKFMPPHQLQTAENPTEK